MFYYNLINWLIKIKTESLQDFEDKILAKYFAIK